MQGRGGGIGNELDQGWYFWGVRKSFPTLGGRETEAIGDEEKGKKSSYKKHQRDVMLTYREGRTLARRSVSACHIVPKAIPY